MGEAIIAAIIAGILDLSAAGYNNYKNRQENEINREYNRENMQLQADIEQQYHEQNVLNDPSMMLQGYKSAGFSDAAAIQAIAGVGSTFNPSVQSNGVSSIPSQQPGSFGSQLANVFQQATNSEYLNNLNDALAGKARSDVKVNDSIVSRNNKEMEIAAKKLDIDTEYLDLAKKLNESQIGLNASQADLNIKQLDRINVEVQKMYAEIKEIATESNLNSMLVLESMVRQQKIRSDIQVNEAQIGVLGEQEGYYSSLVDVNLETVGNIEVDSRLKRVQKQLEDKKLEMSRILGWIPNGNDVDKMVMSMATGNYDQVNRLLDNISYNQSGIRGAINRTLAPKRQANYLDGSFPTWRR